MGRGSRFASGSACRSRRSHRRGPRRRLAFRGPAVKRWCLQRTVVAWPRRPGGVGSAAHQIAWEGSVSRCTARRQRRRSRDGTGAPAPIREGGSQMAVSSDLRLRWIVPLFCAMAVVLVPATAGAVTSSQCDNRVNDTPDTLVPCIQQTDLWNHMKAFQKIANQNPSPADFHPSRNSGEPGYRASVDYVADVMRKAGYDVTIQPYKFTYYAYTSTPTFSEVSPNAHDYALSSEWNPGQSTGTASNARVQPVGGIIIPSPGGSSSGCTMDDFNGFVAGRIALIQR